MKKQILIIATIGLAITAGAQQQDFFHFRGPAETKPKVRVLPLSKTLLKNQRAPFPLQRNRHVLPNGEWLIKSPSYHMPVITGIDLNGPMPNPAYPRSEHTTIHPQRNRLPGKMPNAVPFLFHLK